MTNLATLLERYRAGVEAYNAGVPKDRAEHEQLGSANNEIERQIMASKITTKAEAIAVIDFILATLNKKGPGLAPAP